jgi:hypothetical protein
MTIRYSKTTGVFYPNDIDYGAALPADVQIVAKSDFNIAMSRTVGATFTFDADGVLTITPSVPPTATQVANTALLAQIAMLEAGMTPRRMRDAFKGGAGMTWITALDAQIAALRAQLK